MTISESAHYVNPSIGEEPWTAADWRYFHAGKDLEHIEDQLLQYLNSGVVVVVPEPL